jgi:WD40 repeat protein
MKRNHAFMIFVLIVFLNVGVSAQQTNYDLVWSNGTGGWVKSVAVSVDGNYIAAGSADTYVYFFDAVGRSLWNLRPSTKTGSYINSVSVSSDGSYIAAGSDDSNVYFFDRNGTVMWAYDVARMGVSLVSVAGDGSYISAASDHPNDTVYYFNRRGTRLWSEKVGDVIRGLSVSENGSRIAVGSDDKIIYCFDRDGRLIWTHPSGIFGVSSVAISKDGSLVAAGSRYKEVYLINNKGVRSWTAKTEGNVKHVSFVLNDTSIAVYTDANILQFFSLDGEVLKTRSVDSLINSISISDDGSNIAAGFDSPTVNVYFYSEVVSPTANGSVSEIPPPEKPKITLLANLIDYDLAADFMGFLNDTGVEFVRATASGFEDYKTEEIIIILGGPDAPEGVGEIVQAVLTEEEVNAIREPGVKKMYVKPDIWVTGQKVIVLAGSDRNQTKAAHGENREAVISVII